MSRSADRRRGWNLQPCRSLSSHDIFSSKCTCAQVRASSGSQRWCHVVKTGTSSSGGGMGRRVKAGVCFIEGGQSQQQLVVTLQTTRDPNILQWATAPISSRGRDPPRSARVAAHQQASHLVRQMQRRLMGSRSGPGVTDFGSRLARWYHGRQPDGVARRRQLVRRLVRRLMYKSLYSHSSRFTGPGKSP
jgi:hypothetical protein